MNPNNLTIKTQEVISNAQMIAMRNQNQQIDNLHILKSMLEMDDNVVPFLMRKQECDPKVVAAVVDKEMSRLPKVSGGEFYLGGGAQQALQKVAAQVSQPSSSQCASSSRRTSHRCSSPSLPLPQVPSSS